MAAFERPLAAPLLVALLVHVVAFASANTASLDIFPSGEKQSKPIGSSIILTCKPNVDDTNLISDMQWLDPQNRVIESMNTAAGAHNTKPPMYTELHQDNSLSLFFNSLQEDQAGKYTCKGTYANTMPLNKSVTIDTIVAITWDNAPANQYPILGEDFDIVCQVRAMPPPSVDWLFNGELIKTNEHYIIDTYALKIKNVQESDDGVYTCRASVLTTGELQERPIRVEVHTRPKIEEVMKPYDIIEGETANIPCKATGKPPPRYSWVQSLSQRNLSSADRFGVNADTGDLTIRNVQRDDSGEYQCSASNAAGTAITNVMVNVIVKPKIMEFRNATIARGKEATLVCKAYGRPPPQVTFRKHTSGKTYTVGPQPDDDRIVLTNQVDEASREITVGAVTIRDVLRSDDGLYECVASNAGGDAHKNGHLTVHFPPSFDAMPNVTVWSWEQRPVNLTCIAESIPNATIRWTMHGNENIDKYQHIRQIGSGPISVLSIVPLDRRFYTMYKCIATNPLGTRERVIELREAAKPGEVVQAKMIEISATTVRFDIVPPPAHPDLPVVAISVQYRDDGQQWANAKVHTWSTNSMYVLEGLKPQTAYEFRFAATNEVGLGNWGAFLRQTTPGKTVPNEPRITVKKGPTEYDVSPFNNQYELDWIAPANNGEPIDMYQIKYCQIKRVAGEWETVGSTCQTTEVRSKDRTRHWLKDLSSDAFYSVELRAHNAMGYSKPGFAKFKTARESEGVVVDYTVVTTGGGDTCKPVVTAIATAMMILSITV